MTSKKSLSFLKFFPRKTEMSENVIVNIIGINIENYINRSQLVGKSI